MTRWEDQFTRLRLIGGRDGAHFAVGPYYSLKSTSLASLADLWETCFMPKRAIRIVKHIGQVPCIAVCTFCSQQFKAPTSTLPKVKAATASLQEQFDKHSCEFPVASQSHSPNN